MRRWRERLARWLAPWMAADYDERMRRLMRAHIEAHEAILRDQQK